MGGIGSGNKSQSGKYTTSDMWRLDVRQIHRKGLLTPGYNFGWEWTRNGEKAASINVRVYESHVKLSYRQRSRGNGKWQDMAYPVPLEWTACHYGGRRPWFLCPRCGRRVAVLYGGRIYACRHCHNLAYESQRETKYGRLLNRSHKLRARLGGDRWYLKPKGMHQKTFDNLLAEYQHYEEAADMAFYERGKKLLGW